MSTNNTIVFTDGASRGNPGSGGWGTVVVLDGERVVELGGYVDDTTNNRMELTAAIGALMYLNRTNEYEAPVVIYSDSGYVVQGITEWIDGWINRGWETQDETKVANKELWKDLYDLTKTFDIEWQRIDGHSGIAGNKRADEIATAFADNEDIELFAGSLDSFNEIYETDLLDISVDEEKAKKREEKKKRSNKEAYSYLSLVDGETKRHETWKETEDRVSGVSGAKFKKATSPEEEKEILEDWDVDPEEVE